MKQQGKESHEDILAQLADEALAQRQGLVWFLDTESILVSEPIEYKKGSWSIGVHNKSQRHHITIFTRSEEQARLLQGVFSISPSEPPSVQWYCTLFNDNDEEITRIIVHAVSYDLAEKELFEVIKRQWPKGEVTTYDIEGPPHVN